MSNHGRTILNALSEIISMAAKFLRLDSKNWNGPEGKARLELERLSEKSHFSGLKVQYPIQFLLRGDLWSKFPQMNDSAGDEIKHVLRYNTEETERDGSTEVLLELWRITRRSHNCVATLGQLYTTTILWGSDVIDINVIAVIDGVYCHGPVPAVLECGPGGRRAFTIGRFEWECYVVMADQERYLGNEDGISPGKRLLYLLILDSVAYSHVDICMFSRWSPQLVREEIQRHLPGAFMERFNCAQAGMTGPLMSDEELQESTLLDTTDEGEEKESSRDVVVEKEGEDSCLDSCLDCTFCKNDSKLGESPDLNPPLIVCSLKARLVESTATTEEGSSPGLTGCPVEVLRGLKDDKEKKTPEIDLNSRSVKQGGEKVVMSPGHFRSIMEMLAEKKEEEDTNPAPSGRDGPGIFSIDGTRYRWTIPRYPIKFYPGAFVDDLLTMGVPTKYWPFPAKEDSKGGDKVDVDVLTEKMLTGLSNLEEDADVGEVFRKSMSESKVSPARGEKSKEPRRPEIMMDPNLASTSSSSMPELEEMPALGPPVDLENYSPEWEAELLSPLSEDNSNLDSSMAINLSSDEEKSSKGGSPKGYSPPSTPMTPPCKKLRRSMKARLDDSTLSSDESVVFSPFLTKALKPEEVVTLSSGSSEEESSKKKIGSARRLIHFIDDVGDNAATRDSDDYPQNTEFEDEIREDYYAVHGRPSDVNTGDSEEPNRDEDNDATEEDKDDTAEEKMGAEVEEGDLGQEQSKMMD